MCAGQPHLAQAPATKKPIGAECIVLENYTILMPKLHESYREISVGPETVKIRQDGIINMVNINRITKEMRQPEEYNNESENRSTVVASEHPKTEETHERRLDTTHCKGNVVKRIVRHIQFGDETNYVFHWFRYRGNNDTAEPPKHIPHQFVEAYWR